jgi:photosystem II stability/assembly factor-like uncharacterized protein
MAVGTNGTVVTSNDDGATWQVSNIGISRKFSGVAHLSKQKFLTVCTHRVYRSADSGATWTQSTIASLNPDVLQTFEDVATDGAAKVVVVGKFVKSGHDKGVIQHSTDGGVTFQIVEPELPGLLTAVAYTGNNRFVAAGSGMLKYSTDGGATWSDAGYTNTNTTYRRPTATSEPAPIWNIADIAASTNGRVIAGGGGSYSIIHMPGVVYYSSDGGLTWGDTDYSQKPLYIRGVATNRQGKWIAVGTNIGQYITSTDNGLSWSEFADISTNNRNLFSVTHIQGDKWLAVGAHGTVVSTSDNGATWATVNTGSQASFYDVICVKVN